MKLLHKKRRAGQLTQRLDCTDSVCHWVEVNYSLFNLTLQYPLPMRVGRSVSGGCLHCMPFWFGWLWPLCMLTGQKDMGTSCCSILGSKMSWACPDIWIDRQKCINTQSLVFWCDTMLLSHTAEAHSIVCVNMQTGLSSLWLHSRSQGLRRKVKRSILPLAGARSTSPKTNHVWSLAFLFFFKVLLSSVLKK